MAFFAFYTLFLFELKFTVNRSFPLSGYITLRTKHKIASLAFSLLAMDNSTKRCSYFTLEYFTLILYHPDFKVS